MNPVFSSLSFPYFVAPMVGISHVGFRDLLRHYTPPSLKPVLFTEMLSTRRLPGENIKTSRELRVSARDRGAFVPQLLGNEEKYIAPSVSRLLEQEPWGIDINMGCPVSHTLKHNWGFRLVGQPDYAAEIVRVTRQVTPQHLPVSVKLRGDVPLPEEASVADRQQKLDHLYRFTARLEGAGADWITVHPRTGKARHTGRADWQVVQEVKKRLCIPVVANGDIQTAEDALHIVRELGCDGAMFARAAAARPWILWQLAEAMGICERPSEVTHRLQPPACGVDEGREYCLAILKLSDILWEHFQDEQHVLERIRFFVAIGSRWYEFGHDLWRKTTRCKTRDELVERISEYAEKFENPSVARVKFL